MAAIAIIIGIFVAGVAAGIVVIVSLGIRREERDLTLTGRAPNRKSQGARSLTGLYVRQRSDSPAFFTAPVVRAEPAGTTAGRQRGAGGLDVRPPATRSGDWPRAAPCQRRPVGDGAGCPAEVIVAAVPEVSQALAAGPEPRRVPLCQAM